MIKILHKFVIGACGLAMLSYGQSAQAAVYSEAGDAGDTFATAQLTLGSVGQPLDFIEGNLLSLQDNDFFRFFYSGTGNLTIETGPYTNTPFPSNTFPGFELLSGIGASLGGAAQSLNPSPFGNQTFITGGSIFYSPGISTINYANLPVGEYVLRVDGTGQANLGKPRYVGNYSIRLQGGTRFIQSVPEPSFILSLLAISAIAAIAGIKNRHQQLPESVKN